MLTLMQAQPTALQILWFILIAVLWIGFFVLEGFDFGTSMLYPIIGRKDAKERRVMVNAIGPHWDGNEVWLLTAGGATFAAFPGWYATMFSGLYTALFLVLFGLIIRGVSFEYRSLMPDDRWRDTFDLCATLGSFIVTLVLGVAFANFVKGLPVGSDLLMTTGLWGLFTPFTLLGGAMLVALFLHHGANFLSLKTAGAIQQKARSWSFNGGLVALLLVAAFVIWQNTVYPASANSWLPSWGGPAAWAAGIVAVLAVAVSVFAGKAHRDGIAFLGTAVAILTLFVGIFLRIFGTLGFISTDPANPLDITTASSSALTLGLMRIFAFIMVPIVLAYTAWAYWVFRKRLTVENMPHTHGYPSPSGAVEAPARAAAE